MIPADVSENRRLQSLRLVYSTLRQRKELEAYKHGEPNI
jgi:hypothetical protein